MPTRLLVWSLITASFLLSGGGCNRQNSESSQEKMLSRLAVFGDWFVDLADIVQERYGPPGEGHTRRAGWRALLCTTMPAIDLPVYDKNSAWDSDHYEALFSHDFAIGYQLGTAGAEDDFSPDILAATGPGTAFDAICHSGSEALEDIPHDTVLLIAAELPDVHWMQAKDLEASRYLASSGDAHSELPESPTSIGRLVYFMDGEAWLLDPKTPVASLLRFITIEGADRHDRDNVLGSHLLHRVTRDSCDEG